ncbi:MAG: nucleoside triphosphate pyrophosphohydrolase [Bacteroidales bacterium]|nr:nucleoside triphosphate pyrophosphohydrolase [Bacteroidales bacterium]MDD2424690.1 nucleoside triphosphate pyrophosphohydrolase [Bacteroidales bacterium]MDD3989862.1 nucleoside triphosphate pyrophosphohydrolase [Bacteroidales bacterium]MDD4638446.1 nucleoside triphosphate pyrophosphohydrolase [Bacteroidales bacterium]
MNRKDVRKDVSKENISREVGREKEIKAFVRLLDIMDELREKCPWDREQTFESLRSLTIEETYELSESLLEMDNLKISKELGDILLHIVFYSKIASEKRLFDISDVMNRLCDKLVYRHPHVFGEVSVNGSKDVIENWEALKSTEKDGNKSLLSGVPSSMPSLIKAYRMQDKARAVGFDWDKREQVWDKVKEEIAEFEQESERSGMKEEEFGDLLFSLVNAARLYDINPDTALELTNRKFIRRFNFLEKQVAARGFSLKDISLEEMDRIWNQAKEREK